MSWTEERVEKLKSLVASPDKPSAAKIADELKTTRCAVIGKCHRLGLQLPNTGNNHPRNVVNVSATRTNRRAVNPLGRKVTTLGARRPDYRVRPSSVPIEPSFPDAPLVVDPKHRVQFMQLENHHCRYGLWFDPVPFSEQWFCGTPTADVENGRPYCAAHTQICWDKPRSAPKPRPWIGHLEAAE